jgi:isopentenyl-diphosphate delta-isomerase
MTRQLVVRTRRRVCFSLVSDPWYADSFIEGHLMENINKGLLHRAFSAFVFRPSDGRLLLQQRASEKITFPDMWTNTCCSHPLDDFEQEKVEQNQLGVRVAATRKLEHELGIPQSQVPADAFQYLTKIHYLAPSHGHDGKWGEHESTYVALPCTTVSHMVLVDYILFFTGDVDVTMNPNEIRDYKYVSKEELQLMFDAPGKHLACRCLCLIQHSVLGNLFTPWFKLIARDYLYGWWDQLMARRDTRGHVEAKSLSDLVDDRVVKML